MRNKGIVVSGECCLETDSPWPLDFAQRIPLCPLRMALHTVFSRPLLKQHQAPAISQASLFGLLLYALRLLLPLCAVWNSDGFWLKERSFRETPDVHFARQFVLWAECDHHSVAYSSFPHLNQAFRESGQLRAVSVRDSEQGDQLALHFEVPLDLAAERVTSFQLLLAFRYRLKRQFELRMESLLLLAHQASKPGQGASLEGHLRLAQTRPFFHKGFDFRYNQPVLPPDVPLLAPLDLQHLGHAHSKRDYHTHFVASTRRWIPFRALTNRNQTSFRLDIRILYGEQSFSYEAGFWHLLKWALVQYLAVFLLAHAVLSRAEHYVFEHSLLPSVTHLPDAPLLKQIHSKRH